MQVDFYHLIASPLERVLPKICEKILSSGGRLLIVGDAALLGPLDVQLWSYARDAFLPHGLADQPLADQQPVLLSEGVEAANGATNIAIIDSTWREEALTFSRAFHFFDEARIADARTAWRGLADRPEVERRYWKQDGEGRWQQAA